MAVTYNRMLIDINEKPSDIITAVQNDTNSRYLDVNLYDNGVPINLEGCEVKIFMNKPEKGGEIWNNGVITDAENGRCEFLLTTEALTHFGHLQVQISIWKDNTEILSSQIFEIIVTKSLLGASSVESSNEYGTLVILFQNLYEAYDLMKKMVENIGVPAEVAAQYDLVTMWQAWEFLVAYMKGDLTTMIDNALANSSVQGVLDKIGEPADTGGSSTEGTLMAKENAVLELVQGLSKKMDADVDTLIASVSTASATTTKVLDITGKGKLHRLYASDYSSGTGAMVVTITVDGVSYTATVGVANNAKTRYLIISKQSDIMFDGVFLIVGKLKTAFAGIDDIVNIYENPSCTGGNSDRRVWARLVEPISFESSLNITFKTIGTFGVCKVEYTLDED